MAALAALLFALSVFFVLVADRPERRATRPSARVRMRARRAVRGA
jgi:hypothetical protein